MECYRRRVSLSPTIVNRELHSAIPLPASAENLQENFSSRLNKSIRRMVSPQPSAGAVYRSQSSEVAAASVALFREPRRRPAGLPDCPGWGHNPIPHRVASRRCAFRAYIRNMALRQQQSRSVAHDPSRISRDCGRPVRRADRCSRRRPDDAAWIEDGSRQLRDHPFLLTSTAPPHTPGAVHGMDRSESAVEVAAKVMPRKTAWSRMR
jgi:hypothetical protein